MKKITLLLLIISSISFSQTRTLESNLEGLILEVGDSFTPETNVKYNDGTTGSCEVSSIITKKEFLMWEDQLFKILRLEIY